MHSRARFLNLVGVLSASLLLASCGAIKQVYRPTTPEVINGSTTGIEYTVVDYLKHKAALDTLVNGTPDNLPKAKLLRNQMIHRMREQIDYAFNEYVAALNSGRAITNIGFDIAGLGLSSAATVVGSASIAKLLNAALTGVQGTHLSISKELFRQKAIDVFVAAMSAARQERDNQILQKTALDYAKYTLEEARVDLTDYFYSGTLQEALQTLTAEAGEKNAVEKKKEQAITDQRTALVVPTTDQEGDLEAINGKFDQLRGVEGFAEFRRILEELNVAIPEGTTDADIVVLVRKEISRVRTDPAYLVDLKKAFKL